IAEHEADATPMLIADPTPSKPAVAPSKSATSSSKPQKSQPADNPKTLAQSPSKPPAEQAQNPGTTAVLDTYSLRSAPGRLSLIEGQGGNAQTEAAVVAALNWLVNAQSADGRWNANQFGAGQEQMVLGQDRGGAGR